MKVLIVEDEAGITNFLEQGLQEEGYEVLTAQNGKIGLTAARNEIPDIILLDWMLPEISGLEVCQKLRASGHDMPIIFLTAKDTLQETIEGLRAGANDYIKKPFSFEELLERIKVQLRAKSDTKKDFSIGRIKISLPSRKVFRDNVQVYLTQREFDLLAYLIKHRNEVCTRTQIINDVWDIHFEYDTGVIDVFINGIRKKLELDKEEDFIKTIRGVGYTAEF